MRIAPFFLLLACSDASVPVVDAGVDAPVIEASAPDTGEDVGIDAFVVPDAKPSIPPWQRMPTFDYMGGALLTAPKIVTITWTGDDASLVARMQLLGDTLPTTPWWTDTTSEYCIEPAHTPCIGKGSNGGHIVLNETALTSYVDTWSGDNSTLYDFMQAHITSGDFPTPDAQTLYMFYFPAGTTIFTDWGKVCGSAAGYHASHAFTPKGGGAKVETAYAIMPRCAGEPSIAIVASHEMIEAATDPHPGLDRGFVMQDPSWTTIGDEDGDVCDHSWGFDLMVESTFTVQRGWSNKSALAGHDPCVTAPSQPYFNAAPESGAQTIYLSVGESMTIDVDPFSDQTMAPWDLSVVDLGTVMGAGASLDLKLDKATVQNGDKVKLTIKLLSNPAIPYTGYGIVSKSGPTTHRWNANVRVK